VKNAAFRNATTCRLVEVFQIFGEAYCLQLRGRALFHSTLTL